MWIFNDRSDAGRQLGEKLGAYRGASGVLVLGVPRGGVAVAREVATGLAAPLDVFLVRRLLVPGREGLAMGQIATGGTQVLNHGLVNGLGLGPQVVASVAETQRRELDRRQRLYRGDLPPPLVTGRTVILVDDGMAAGSTMLATIRALRALAPRRLVAALPVTPRTTSELLASELDELVCLVTHDSLYGAAEWYRDFPPVTDAEVRRLLGPVVQHVARGAAHRGLATYPPEA